MAFVNLYSDTQTRPTEGMRARHGGGRGRRRAARRGPHRNALEERVAALLGHEAAVFLPSGTMCNEIAMRLHIRPGGDEMLIGRETHPLIAEAGGPAALSGAVHHGLDGDGGIFTRGRARAGDPRPGPAAATARATRLVSVEQTTNIGGGRVWPLEQIAPCSRSPAAPGCRAHLDGARLMNAVVASGVDAAEFAAGFDTAWLDFTKGLGAPVGACLAGSADLIDEAWRYKQMLGGAMRQAGIVAAAGLYALDHHVERLAEDHANARRLAEGLAALDGVALDPATVETNIVIFEVPDAAAFTAAWRAEGVEMAVRAHARARGDPPRRRRRGHRPRAGRRGAGARRRGCPPVRAQTARLGQGAVRC